MTQFAARIEYDGTAYEGFQKQRQGHPTIQDAIEQAITRLARRPVRLTAAGRTDSGVHATGQVIAFSLEWTHGTDALQRALNADLPADIAILQLIQVSSPFHPRYDARRRAYEYHIDNSPVRRPLNRNRCWHVIKPLDVDRMQAAAQHLVGVHDFATFGRPPQGTNTVREVYTAVWRHQAEKLVFSIEANAFLFRMVRSLVGSLKLVGDGSWTVRQFMAALQACDRSRSGKVVPPQGLYLVSVTYDRVAFGNQD